MTVLALNNLLKRILLEGGADNPAGDAMDILGAAGGYTRIDLIVNRDTEAAEETVEKAIQLARRRASGEPIQYVIGSWCFMGRDYLVGEGVLIPRDDTEVVTQAALSLLKPLSSPTVVDLCSGSGVIAVTIKKERPDATVFAVEKSEAAFGYLRKNTEKNGADVRLILADLRDCAKAFENGSLDLIVSNPPYVRSGDIDALQREIRYEPRLALDGGESGYDFYEAILAAWTKKLKPGGCIALELGEGQYETVADMLRKNGYTGIGGRPDIQGIVRAVTAEKI